MINFTLNQAKIQRDYLIKIDLNILTIEQQEARICLILKLDALIRRLTAREKS